MILLQGSPTAFLETWDWVVIIAFLALIITVGVSFTRKAGKDLSSFFLGSRNLPWYVAGISMVATTFAADTPLAVTEIIGKDGIAGNWVWWNFLMGGMLTTFFFARLWRRAQVLTEVELIELRYSGPAAGFLRGFKALYLGLFFNVIIMGWVNFALISLLMGFFDINAETALWYTAGAMVFVAVYSSLSGLLGIAITDNIQFVIALGGCIVLAVLVVNSEEVGGIAGLKAQMDGPQGAALKFFPEIGNASNAGYALTLGLAAFLARVAVQWWGSWYPGAEPGGGGYIVQRMMSAKTEKGAVYATLFFQIAHYCLRPWPWIVVGLCALVLYPDLGDHEKQMGFVYAMRDFLPTGLRGLLLVAFFAAYMSTISTQLNWGASYLINDFYKRFVHPPSNFMSEAQSEKHYVLASRITTVVLMFVAVYVTTRITSIKEIWDFIFQAGAGLGLVLILRWYWWRINAWSEIAASLAPFIGYGLSVFYFDFGFADSMFFTVALTTVIWLLVTYLTPPTEEHTLIEFYEKVRPDGGWAPIARITGLPQNRKRLLQLTGCWISAVVFTYGILFLTGKIILQEWEEALYLAIITFISFFVLRIFIIRSGVFKD